MLGSRSQLQFCGSGRDQITPKRAGEKNNGSDTYLDILFP